eukprot:158516-Chlamydomonas_euryale.AAC.1
MAKGRGGFRVWGLGFPYGRGWLGCKVQRGRGRPSPALAIVQGLSVGRFRAHAHLLDFATLELWMF